MGMTPHQQARYALNWNTGTKTLGPEARTIYHQLVADQATQDRSQYARPQRDPVEEQARKFLTRRWLEVLIPAAMLITGIIILSATASKVALCNSLLGQLAQGLDQQANLDCSGVNDLHSFGDVLLWIGILGGVGMVIRLWMAYDFVGKERAKAARAAQAKREQEAAQPKA
jgi:hypothetical protein